MEATMTRRQFGKGSALLAVATAAIVIPELEGCSTSWITTLENDIPELVNIASSIISIVALATGNGTLAAASAALITAETQILQGGLQTLQDAVTAYNGGKGQGTVQAISDALKAVATDAQTMIAKIMAAGIGIPTTVQTAIVAGIGLLITIISSIQLLLPGAPVPVAVGQTATAKAKANVAKTAPPNATQIRTGYNSVLVMQGFAADQIQ